MNRIWILILCLSFFTSVVAADETLRCGSKLVTIGMSAEEVLKYCGEPTSREVEEHDIRSGNRVVGKTQLNRWFYSRGSAGAPKVLEFDQDKLITIK
ncbi:MAG: DUF2845 domain-containing protein [Gammaproteobacteria bacterium]|jgi:hypothetical protein|nr:DUF2845 domain-containing protein [Gammaproteobacteria bacterium]